MDIEKWSLRVGVAALLCALLFRLGSNGTLQAAAQALVTPETMAVMMFLESGRVVRPAPLPEVTEPVPVQPQNTQQPLAQAVFAAGDADLVEVNSYCGYEADVPAMIQQPLSWDLQQEQPTVLIVHSHGSESYQKTADYKECSSYRTLDTAHNMISVGAELKKVLEAGGITVLHDTTMHDQPSYSASYSQSRKSVKQYLEEYPSICLVLDLHRDAADTASGQIRYTVDTPEGTAAQLMLVLGTNHDGWQDNLSLATKLHVLLEKQTPGICRPISVRAQRYNQDLSPAAVLVEVGAAGNSHQEALLSISCLAEAVIALASGSQSS